MRIKKWLAEQHPDWQRILILCRHEIFVLKAHTSGKVSFKQRRRQRQLAQRKNLKVQIGAGSNVAPGWLNVDVIPQADLRLDIRRGFPLANDSVQFIYTEHFLDHLAYPHGIQKVLLECYRILSPGGVLRGIVHDASKYFTAYVNDSEAYFSHLQKIGANPHPTRMEFINHIFRFNGLHQFIYDFTTIERTFREAGFEKVVQSSINASQYVELNLDQESSDREPQSLYFEATK